MKHDHSDDPVKLPDRENVISGLETCISACSGNFVCLDCRYSHDYGGGCEIHLLGDAITLLKSQEQEPRVLTLDDIPGYDGAVLVEYTGTFGNPMFEWLLYQVQHNQYVMFSNRNRSNVVFDAKDYGNGWRCWTSRPTDQQREATSWEL